MPVAMAGYKLILSQKDGYEKIFINHFSADMGCYALCQCTGKILQFVTGQEINIGTLSEDDEASAYRFVFHNSSKRSIKLTKVTTTCGCTAAQFTQKELNPGEKGEIVLTYHPDGHPGKLYTRAFVYTDQSSSTPVAELVLTGMVTPSKKQWRNFPYKWGI